MKSMKCNGCSLVQWPSHQCKRCGRELAADQSPQFVSGTGFSTGHGYPADQGHPYATYAQRELKSGMALASMILAIIAFPTMFILIGILLAPVAFILGIIALVRANKRPAIYGGKGFAIAGIAVSSVVCFFFVPIIAAIAIPNILAAKRAANEGSAMAAMRKLAAAQVAYSDSDESGGCGNMRALAGNNLVHENLSTGTRNGYRFSVSGNASDTNGCEIKATPLSPSEGTRSFYYSSVDGVFRVQSKGGAANYSSPPVDSESD